MGQRRLQDHVAHPRSRSAGRPGTRTAAPPRELTLTPEAQLEEAKPATHLPGLKRTRWAWITATFFGAGFLKPGPGTYGSVAAVIVWFVVANHVPYRWLPLITLGMAAFATAIGIPAATRVARESGRKDPQIVVIDEVAGQWLTLVFCAPYYNGSFMPFALLALICFRVFDILKPPPIRRLERLPAGIGIMVDDLGAGVYALIVHVILQQGFMIAHILRTAPQK